MTKGVRLPSAVKRQGEAADAALAALRNPQGTNDGDQYVSEGEPTTDTGITTQESSPEQNPQTTAETDQGDGDRQPNRPESNDSGDFDWKAEAEALREERDKAVRRFESLRGKYDAEVPRLSQQVRDLQGQIEELKNAPQATSTPEGEFTFDGKDEAELREAYGDDIVNRIIAAERRAAEAARKLEEKVNPRLERLDRLEAETERSADQAVFDAIAKEHPDWERINQMATFHKFLAEINPDTGEPRQVAIDRAMARRDAVPINRQLAAFKRRMKKGATSLESQVVPGDTGRTEEPNQPDQKIYSSQEISLFQKRLANQVSRGVPMSDEQKRLDALYTKALVDGRVR